MSHRDVPRPEAGTIIDEDLATRDCIDIRLLTGTIQRLGVADYVDAQRKARHFSPQGKRTQGIAWTNDCPPVEALNRDWQERHTEAFRVSDWAAYEHQMRILLGLVDAVIGVYQGGVAWWREGSGCS